MSVQGKSVEAGIVFDTGATRSFVSLKVAEELGYTKYREPKEALLAVKSGKALMVGELAARVTMLGCELPLSYVFGSSRT